MFSFARNVQLEATARQLIRRVEASLAKGEARGAALLTELRMAGIDTLRHFRSARNADLLGTLSRLAPKVEERRLAAELLGGWRRGPR